MGKMSTDRVKFFWPTGNSSSYSGIDACTLFHMSFGVCASEFNIKCRNSSEGFWVICRPSQFARFIIYRNDLRESTITYNRSSVMSNLISCLKPKLIEADSADCPLEVWRNLK